MVRLRVLVELVAGVREALAGIEPGFVRAGNAPGQSTIMLAGTVAETS
jgi:hypothetical protein